MRSRDRRRHARDRLPNGGHRPLRVSRQRGARDVLARGDAHLVSVHRRAVSLRVEPPTGPKESGSVAPNLPWMRRLVMVSALVLSILLAPRATAAPRRVDPPFSVDRA